MVTAADYQLASGTREYMSFFELDKPLVSICIPTFNRAELLRTRSLRSAIEQTYSNLEIIVVGDCCTDHTEAVVHSFNDPRIRFVNLPVRGNYPEDPFLRWNVAGSIPTNHALELATGHFITHLDDDDEFTRDRIEKLVSFAKHTRVDLLYHPFFFVVGTGQLVVNDAIHLTVGKVTTSSMFYHSWLKCIPWDPMSYVLNEPGDWNKVRRMVELGVKTLRYPECLTLKY